MGASAHTPFRFDVVAALSADRQRVRRYLESYFFDHADPDEGFTGRFFEKFVAASDPNRFTPMDIVAVSTLSVYIPPAAAASILLDGDVSTRLTGLLAQAPPPDAELATVDTDEIADGSALAELYSTLGGLSGLGPTKTSKLLAAKRPGLVPIRDSIVSALLGAGHRWWAPMRELAQSAVLRDLIHDASVDVVPSNTSFLRRLDVVLWRWGMDTGDAQQPEG